MAHAGGQTERHLRKQTIRSFTLIEFLAIINIITMFIALILPAATRAGNPRHRLHQQRRKEWVCRVSDSAAASRRKVLPFRGLPPEDESALYSGASTRYAAE